MSIKMILKQVKSKTALVSEFHEWTNKDPKARRNRSIWGDFEYQNNPFMSVIKNVAE